MFANARPTCASLVMSQRSGCTLLAPSSRASFAVSARFLALRPRIDSFEPSLASRSAIARPIPEPAPVTTMWRGERVLRRAIRTPPRSVPLRLEPALGIDGRHAAHARGRHRLAVDLVADVARGEHALDRGARAGVHLDVAGLVE